MRCPSCKKTTVIKHDAQSGGRQQLLCLSCSHGFYRAFTLKPKALWFRLLAGSVLFSTFLLPLPIQGLSTLLPRQKSSGAELAILLGRGPGSQAELALAASILWSNNKNLSFFVSGMTDAPEIIELMTEMGVPETQLKGERCSQSTWENGLFSDLILDSATMGKVLLITDSYHMPRAFLVFKGLGFNVQPHSITLEQSFFDFPEKNNAALREYAALVTYSISGRFSPKSLKQRIAYESEASQKIRDWKCQLN